MTKTFKHRSVPAGSIAQGAGMVSASWQRLAGYGIGAGSNVQPGDAAGSCQGGRKK
jgi:hypothetical protein